MSDFSDDASAEYWGMVGSGDIKHTPHPLEIGNFQKYKVQKFFIDETGHPWTIGQTLVQDQIAIRMHRRLEEYGFIKKLGKDGF